MPRRKLFPMKIKVGKIYFKVGNSDFKVEKINFKIENSNSTVGNSKIKVGISKKKFTHYTNLTLIRFRSSHQKGGTRYIRLFKNIKISSSIQRGVHDFILNNDKSILKRYLFLWLLQNTLIYFCNTSFHFCLLQIYSVILTLPIGKMNHDHVIKKTDFFFYFLQIKKSKYGHINFTIVRLRKQ